MTEPSELETLDVPGFEQAIGPEIPASLPVLPLKETVVFPESMTPLAIGQERSVKLIEDVVSGERLLALVTVQDASVETPSWDDLYTVGTAAVVHKMIRVPDGTLRILVQGLRRISLGEPVDPAHATARYEQGLLTIVLPIAAKPPKRERVSIAIGARDE